MSRKVAKILRRKPAVAGGSGAYDSAATGAPGLFDSSAQARPPDNAVEQFATIIQARFRGMQGRKHMKRYRKEAKKARSQKYAWVGMG